MRSGMHRVPTLMSLTTAKECYSADLASNTEAASFFGVERVSRVDCARSGRGSPLGLGRSCAAGAARLGRLGPRARIVAPS